MYSFNSALAGASFARALGTCIKAAHRSWQVVNGQRSLRRQAPVTRMGLQVTDHHSTPTTGRAFTI
jgi:hypothetical protein